MVQEGQSGPDKEPFSQRSPMEHASAPQVSYESAKSPTKALSEPHVNTMEAAVPEIAALPYEQSAVQDFPRTVSRQS